MTHFGACSLSESSSGPSQLPHGPVRGLYIPSPPPPEELSTVAFPSLSVSASGEARAWAHQLCQRDLPERFQYAYLSRHKEPLCQSLGVWGVTRSQ